MQKQNSWLTPARSYAPGIGDAVADRTINRKLDPNTLLELPAWTEKGPDTRPFVRETWEQVANRVAAGNASLVMNSMPMKKAQEAFPGEFNNLHHHMRQASVLMSGRHLQHTDHSILSRNMEVLTNCSTAASSTLLFYLLLNGSGVGRSYDDSMMVVDWNQQPQLFCAIDPNHQDVTVGEIDSEKFHDPEVIKSGLHSLGVPFEVFEVPDSREGWAQAIEQLEVMTFEGKHKHALVLDFSKVRPKGSPIGGMQNRPASGPGPLMHALAQVNTLRDGGRSKFAACMHVDHYLAECVLVGGARRAARMATKTWRDKSVLEFVTIKRGGVLWSSNNSVTVDEAFWNAVYNDQEGTHSHDPEVDDMQAHAVQVYKLAVFASYQDKTGEPGFINVDKLAQVDQGLDKMLDGNYAGSEKLQMSQRMLELQKAIVSAFMQDHNYMITNPCGEIPLSKLGGYCVIADVVPLHAQSDDDAEDAFRTAVRALMRVNTMDSLYAKEVKRTNRIGVGFTGIHEYAWQRFGFGFRDLIDEEKSQPFWRMLSRFSNACVDEAVKYARVLGVEVPHTITTVKPAGTTSKLFDLTEGVHLPSMREYVRWVQFRNDDPLVEQYRLLGYPVRELKSYSGTTIVGFPHRPRIVAMGMGDRLVTAAEATPEEQYQWLRLLEKYWLHGFTYSLEGHGIEYDSHPYGGQVSYTLKYDPMVTSFEKFSETFLYGQSSVKCCSVMPQVDTTAYEYQPEEPVSRERFEQILAGITDPKIRQEIAFEHVDCGTGGCPIDFGTNA